MPSALATSSAVPTTVLPDTTPAPLTPLAAVSIPPAPLTPLAAVSIPPVPCVAMPAPAVPIPHCA